MIFFPLFGAAMAATAAFLQVEARWWHGVTCAAALMSAGLAAFGVMDAQTSQSPASGIVVALVVASVCIGFGSVVALGLRGRVRHGKIVFFAFAGMWILFIGLRIVA
jgi:hypothetical protein